MKLFSMTKNTFVLWCTALVVVGFFVGGLFHVLDHFITKTLLFFSFGALVIYAISNANKNKKKSS